MSRPVGVWIIAGTPVTEPYPCRCNERRGPRCNPAFCPCAAVPHPADPECCGNRTTPEDIVRAQREYDAWKRARS